MEYTLEKRTLEFGQAIILLCRDTKRSHIVDPVINQLIRSGTSVGANYCEANGASSKSDFRNKIHICKKEAQETRYWLKLLYSLGSNSQIADLIKEAHELSMIFGKIASSTGKK